jgi:hypothetical protein
VLNPLALICKKKVVLADKDPGNIAYFFNEEDQSISTQKDITTLRKTLDASGEKERNYHESLYNTIGFFQAQLEKIPSSVFTHISKRQFIYPQWAVYSDQLEQRYHELVLNNTFNQFEFFAEAEKQFTNLMRKAILTYQPEH